MVAYLQRKSSRTDSLQIKKTGEDEFLGLAFCSSKDKQSPYGCKGSKSIFIKQVLAL